MEDGEHGTHTEEELDSLEERVLRCASCGQGVASEEDILGFEGAGAVQVFANPAGYVWEVLTVRDAPGVSIHGRPTTEFTWFAGYAWRTVACAACGVHLGWRFDGGRQPPSFFGLVRSRIR